MAETSFPNSTSKELMVEDKATELTVDEMTELAVKRELTEEEKKRLKTLINKHERMVFMKGTPKLPMCDYSKRMLQVVKNHGVDYETFDILDDNFVREGLKIYSNWPTYPQLYVRGQFIGGLDTVLELLIKQELRNILNPPR